MSALMALAVIYGNKTKAMGSVMGMLTMAHSMGMLLGSLSAGLIMDVFQLRQAFSFGSIIMIAGAVIFFICTYRKGVRGQGPEVGNQGSGDGSRGSGIGDL